MFFFFLQSFWSRNAQLSKLGWPVCSILLNTSALHPNEKSDKLMKHKKKHIQLAINIINISIQMKEPLTKRRSNLGIVMSNGNDTLSWLDGTEGTWLLFSFANLTIWNITSRSADSNAACFELASVDETI